MVSGMACYLTFSSVESESRFKKWVVNGNDRADSMGLTSLGLKAHVLKVEDFKYLFLWEHIFMFSLSWFLRFMLWVQLRRVRKSVSISRVNRLELVDLVLKRGLRD